MEHSFSYMKAMLGFIAFLSVVLVTLLAKETLESSLRLGVIAMSIALPALITHIGIWEEVDLDLVKSNKGAPYFIIGVSGGVGYVAGFVALFSIFWHFSDVAAVLFGISAVVWIFLVFKYVAKYMELPNKPLEK